MMTTPSERKPIMPTDQVRRERLTLLAAVLLLAGMLRFVAACGDNDLIFPGEIVFTPTSEPTATGTPDDEEDDDEEF